MSNRVVAPDDGCIGVVARFRPLNEVEAQDADSLPFVVSGDLVEDHHRGGVYTCFDHILGPSASQADAFEATTRPLVDSHLSGYNVALFAYGQSGGGKTYSLLGRDGVLEGRYTGIIPRTVKDLFDRAALLTDTVQFSVSFFEIYRDEVYDLLHLDPEGKSVKIPGREDRHMSRLKEFVVDSMQEATQVLGVGRDQRRYAPMPLNPVSSRSHGIFAVHTRRQYSDRSWTKSSFYFVDLMGSEALVEEAGMGNFQETIAVNRDLLSLKRVITALGQKAGDQHSVPPYRESTLTWVLRDVLGGNSKAVMLLTASAHAMQYHATQNTLEFGTALKGINRTVTACDRKLGVKELEELVKALRQQIAEKDSEIAMLKALGEGVVGDSELARTLQKYKATIKELQEEVRQGEETFESERRVWLIENEAMAERLASLESMIESGASTEALQSQLKRIERSPDQIKRAVGQIKAGQDRETDEFKRKIEELKKQLECKDRMAQEMEQEHSFQMELLEKSRETAVQDADTAETQLAKAEERNAMLQRLLEKSGVEEPDDSMSQSPERDEGHQEEDVDPNDNAALNRHVASLRSKLEQCEREKEDVEDAMADLKEKLKEQLFCLKMAQQSLKIRDFMNTSM